MSEDKLKIGKYEFDSRLFVGTGKYATIQHMTDSIRASGTQLVTMSVKRVDLNRKEDHLLAPLRALNVSLLPNTAGARTAKEAVFAACLAREALSTDLIKLEVHPDPKYLLPDPVETLTAARELVDKGFTVLPYCQADPVLCKKLAEAGCACVMPLAAPIGSNRGLKTRQLFLWLWMQDWVLRLMPPPRWNSAPMRFLSILQLRYREIRLQWPGLLILR